MGRRHNYRNKQAEKVQTRGQATQVARPTDNATTLRRGTEGLTSLLLL